MRPEEKITAASLEEKKRLYELFEISNKKEVEAAQDATKAIEEKCNHAISNSPEEAREEQHATIEAEIDLMGQKQQNDNRDKR